MYNEMGNNSCERVAARVPGAWLEPPHRCAFAGSQVSRLSPRSLAAMLTATCILHETKMRAMKYECQLHSHRQHNIMGFMLYRACYNQV